MCWNIAHCISKAIHVLQLLVWHHDKESKGNETMVSTGPWSGKELLFLVKLLKSHQQSVSQRHYFCWANILLCQKNCGIFGFNAWSLLRIFSHESIVKLSSLVMQELTCKKIIKHVVGSKACQKHLILFMDNDQESLVRGHINYLGLIMQG